MPRISDLPTLSSPEASDILPIVDETDATTKSISIANLGTYIGTNYIAGGLEGNAVGPINMVGNTLNMGTGSGYGGGNVHMDGGGMWFPQISGNYDNPAWINTGSFGEFGGISQYCYAGFEENWQNGVLSLSGPYAQHPNSYVSNNINGPVGVLTSIPGYDLAITAFASQLLTINFDTNNYWCMYSPDSGDSLSLWCGDANKGINFSEFDGDIAINLLGNYFNLNNGGGSGGGRINIDGGQVRDSSDTLIYSNGTFYGSFNGDGSNLTNLNGLGYNLINSILVDVNGDVITSGGYVLLGDL